MSQSEAPAPKSDSSLSFAFLLCNMVYSLSFLKSNVTDFVCVTRLDPSQGSLAFCCLQFAILYYHSVGPCCFSTLLPQRQRFLFTWKYVSQPCHLIAKHCHLLSIVLGHNLSYGNLWEIVNCITIGNLITKKKSQSQSFSSDEIIIPSSSCGAVSPSQDALVPVVGPVGRVYKQCEECHSCAFCLHNC